MRCMRCGKNLSDIDESFLGGTYCRECICKNGCITNTKDFIETKFYVFIRINNTDKFICMYSNEYYDMIYQHIFQLEFHYDESSNKVILTENIPLANVIYCIRNGLKPIEAYNINTELIGADPLDLRAMIRII